MPPHQNYYPPTQLGITPSPHQSHGRIEAKHGSRLGSAWVAGLPLEARSGSAALESAAKADGAEARIRQLTFDLTDDTSIRLAPSDVDASINTEACFEDIGRHFPSRYAPYSP